MPAKHTAVLSRRDWVGFSPRAGLNGGGQRKGPAVILLPAGSALQSSAWQTCSRQVSVLLEVVLEGLMLQNVESKSVNRTQYFNEIRAALQWPAFPVPTHGTLMKMCIEIVCVHAQRPSVSWKAD